MKRRKQWLLLPAVLLALVLSGCAGGASGSGEAAAAAVPPEITESSLDEAGEEEELHPGTEANEETEKQQRTDTAGGETDVRETDVRAMDTDGIQVTAENSTVVSRDPADRQQKTPSPEMVQKAAEALNYYFDVTLDTKDFEITSRFSPEEVYEGDPYKANTTLFFASPENREKTGVFTGEYVTPEYMVSFLENGEIKDIYLSGMNTVWEDAQRPPTVEEAKKVTRQFLISKKLFAEKDIELLGAAFTNDTSIAVIYKDGKDGAIVVTVDVASGKVDCFDRQSRGRAMRWIAPLDAGAGKG